MVNSEHDTILSGILEIQGYFNMSDLYIKFEKMGIKNRIMINNTVDELCDSGHLECSEIEDGVYAFEVVR